MRRVRGYTTEDLSGGIRDVLAKRAHWAVVQGDAMTLLRHLPSGAVDAVITDPPYSSGGASQAERMRPTGKKYVQSGTRLKRPDFVGDNRDQRSFRYWSTLWLSECLRVARPGAPVCVFTDWRQLPSVTDAIQSGGWIWRGIVTWDKTEAARPRLGGFRSQSEFVVWGTKGQLDSRQRLQVGCLPGAFRSPVVQRDKFHQTGKPTVLMREIVRVCPDKGVVLDPFAGSGTTLVAALVAGRRAIGFEYLPAYAEIAAERCAAIGRGEGEDEHGLHGGSARGAEQEEEA